MNIWIILVAIVLIWYYRTLYTTTRARFFQYETIVRNQDRIITESCTAQQNEYKTFKYYLYRALKESFKPHPASDDSAGLAIPVEYETVFDENLYIQLVKCHIMHRTAIHSLTNAKRVDSERAVLLDAFYRELNGLPHPKCYNTLNLVSYNNNLIVYTYKEIAEQIYAEMHGRTVKIVMPELE